MTAKERNDTLANDKEKLSRFISAVNSVTDKQVQDIVSEAEKESERILSAARDSAEEAKKRYLDDNTKMTSGKYVRMISKAELDRKKEILLTRERLTGELFDRVIKRLEEYTQTEEYALLMEKRLSQEEELSDALICIRPADMPLAERFAKAVGGGKEFQADDTIKYGGYSILRRDRGTITDKTFDSTLSEQQNLFSSKNLTEGRDRQ